MCETLFNSRLIRSLNLETYKQYKNTIMIQVNAVTRHHIL